jgi:hypothetical protein
MLCINEEKSNKQEIILERGEELFAATVGCFFFGLFRIYTDTWLFIYLTLFYYRQCYTFRIRVSVAIILIDGESLTHSLN